MYALRTQRSVPRPPNAIGLTAKRDHARPRSIHSLIDSDTPTDAQTWTNPVNSDTYHLVFSDEFEVEGRTFWEGDDPFWTAVDLWYGGE